MLVDSHCHLNFAQFSPNLDFYLDQMQQNQVSHILCVGTNPNNLPDVVKLADEYANIFASVGVHPEENLEGFNLTSEFLLQYTDNPKVIAIGETGLDYYPAPSLDMTWQQDRFILHIEVAKQCQLPLIIHTRNSIQDTLSILSKHEASKVSGVMHCFTENLAQAKLCLDLGFYISISGIVTFKNAAVVQEVAQYIPLDRLLVETDAPFLAPVPFRGKLNHPALVKHTAQYIANLKGISLKELANATTNNFFKLFAKAHKFLNVNE